MVLRFVGSYIITFLLIYTARILIEIPGHLFVKSKVNCNSNDKLLNNLKESVIIAHRQTG